MLTGASASNGLLRLSSFAHSRTWGNTSWASRRMQVMESRCETFPSLPHTAMMPGRVSSNRWRMRGSTCLGVPQMIMPSTRCRGLVVQFPDLLRLRDRCVECDIRIPLLRCPDDRFLTDDTRYPHARIGFL